MGFCSCECVEFILAFQQNSLSLSVLYSLSQSLSSLLSLSSRHNTVKQQKAVTLAAHLYAESLWPCGSVAFRQNIGFSACRLPAETSLSGSSLRRQCGVTEANLTNNSVCLPVCISLFLSLFPPPLTSSLLPSALPSTCVKTKVKSQTIRLSTDRLCCFSSLLKKKKKKCTPQLLYLIISPGNACYVSVKTPISLVYRRYFAPCTTYKCQYKVPEQYAISQLGICVNHSCDTFAVQ